EAWLALATSGTQIGLNSPLARTKRVLVLDLFILPDGPGEAMFALGGRRNSKFEIRNKSKIQTRKSETAASSRFAFSFWVIRVCFGFRISDFGFRIWFSSGR